MALFHRTAPKMGNLIAESTERDTLKACEDLSIIAHRMQREVCANINRDVPVSVVGMPYARQYVLETLAKLLQACV